MIEEIERLRGQRWTGKQIAADAKLGTVGPGPSKFGDGPKTALDASTFDRVVEKERAGLRRECFKSGSTATDFSVSINVDSTGEVRDVLIDNLPNNSLLDLLLRLLPRGAAEPIERRRAARVLLNQVEPLDGDEHLVVAVIAKLEKFLDDVAVSDRQLLQADELPERLEQKIALAFEPGLIDIGLGRDT